MFSVDPSKLKCPKLEYRGGVAVCLDYVNRPQFCKDFPSSEKDSIEGCGFKFEEKK